MPEKRLGSAQRRGPGRGMRIPEKSKDTKKALGNFIKYIGRQKWLILCSALFALTASLLNLVGPGKISEMTDEIQNGLSGTIDLDAVISIAITLVIIYAVGFFLNYAQGFIMTGVAQNITYRMRKDISKKINRLPLRFFDNSSTGNILSRITNDVDTVGQMMNQSVSQLVSQMALFIGSIIMMFATNALMAVCGILSSLIGFVAVVAIIKRSQKYFVRQQAELGMIDGHIEEIYSGHEVVKAYNAEDEAAAEFNSINGRLYETAWKSQFFGGIMMPIMTFIGNFAYVVVCVVGALLVLGGQTSFGTIVAFMIYIRFFTQPLQTISQVAVSVQSLAAACERVFEFIDEEEMESEENNNKIIDPETVRGDVAFKNVRFGYYPEKTIIHNLTAEAKPGMKVAIVGPTGAGKTTLVNLLMRFYEVLGGEITIDGTNIAEIKRNNVHALFGMVLQDTWLFEGTMRENLVFNKEGVSDETLDRICAAAGLTDLVAQMPHGYDTMLDESVALSAGQRQLITIARAMVADSPLMILDEATSSVDTRTELKVQQAMDTLTGGRTSFVIAHRLSTIKNADLILVMKDGDVIESGGHRDLMEKGGFYADLYNSQFEPQTTGT